MMFVARYRRAILNALFKVAYVRQRANMKRYIRNDSHFSTAELLTSEHMLEHMIQYVEETRHII